ncbi:hypothetical protein GCM10027612_67210 [Microbispora bryophytorum subsp. camponoti]
MLGSKSRLPKPDAFDWMSETPIPSPSTTHRYVVSPGPAGASGRGAPLGVDQRAAGGGRAERRDGGLVEDVEPVVPGRPGRLHQQVGPARVGRVGGRSELGEDLQGQQEQVALGVRGNGPDAVSEHLGAQRLHPVGVRPGQVLLGVLAAAQFQQSFAELALVERRPAALAERGEGSGDTGSADHVPGPADGREVPGSGQRADELPARGEQRRGGEAFRREADRGGQQVGERQAAVPLVQRQPPVGAAGHRDRADVVQVGHPVETLRPQSAGIGARARPPRGVQRAHGSVVDEGEQVAAETAHVRGGDRQHRVRGDGRVHRVAAFVEQGDARRRGQMIDRAYHAVQGIPSLAHVRRCYATP